jgi:hypothetical protein
VPHLLGDPIDWVYCNLIRIELASRAWERENAAWARVQSPEAAFLASGDDFYISNPHILCAHCCPQVQRFDTDRRQDIISSQTMPTGKGVPCQEYEAHAAQVSQSGSASNSSREPNSYPVKPIENHLEWIHARATVMMYLEVLRGDGGPQYDLWTNLVTKRHDSTVLCLRCQRNLTLELAHALANGRTWHVSNAVVSLIMFGWSAISAFATVIGGSWSSVPGGRIGLAVFYHFLVMAVLLSSTIGSFPTQNFCRETVQMISENYDCDFEVALWETYREHGRQASIFTGIEKSPSARARLSNQMSMGLRRDGNGVYRRRTIMKPSNGQLNSRRSFHDRPHWFLFILAALPVMTSCACSIATLWFLPPHGPNPRLFLVCSLAAVFTLSTVITSVARNLPRLISDLAHIKILLIKDLLFGVPSLAMILLASCGLFNSCHAWSGIWLLGDKAYISLNNDSTFEANVKERYPIIFCVSIGVQFASFASIVLLERKGLSLLRWSAKTRKHAWELRTKKHHGNESRSSLGHNALILPLGGG